ncbi:hypothetical protein PINS_up013667 [Pythium insidiosum]|nr:hypothetical protein PINS_up013667 [Pythium insidiosum]
MGTRKQAMPLHINHEQAVATSNMPISLAKKRSIQSAKDRSKEQGVRPATASAHHLRQIAKLREAAASIPKTSNAAIANSLEPLSIQKQLLHSTAKLKLTAVATTAPRLGGGGFGVAGGAGPLLSPIQQRPQSSGAFKPRRIERTRFRYFCTSRSYHSLSLSSIRGLFTVQALLFSR